MSQLWYSGEAPSTVRTRNSGTSYGWISRSRSRSASIREATVLIQRSCSSSVWTSPPSGRWKRPSESRSRRRRVVPRREFGPAASRQLHPTSWSRRPGAPAPHAHPSAGSLGSAGMRVKLGESSRSGGARKPRARTGEVEVGRKPDGGRTAGGETTGYRRMAIGLQVERGRTQVGQRNGSKRRAAPREGPLRVERRSGEPLRQRDGWSCDER